MEGWTGKRLMIDLGIRRVWMEEISEEHLRKYIGGRGLNGQFFLDRVDSSLSPFSPENPIAFAVGPLSGTFAPCSGWTSISTVSPIPYPSRYCHTSLPGHLGPQIKFVGFDQLIITGKAERPVTLAIDEKGVRFEEAKHLWGKDTAETTIALQEETGDRNIEVLCIGPAGENGVAFANVTNRFSWTGDHIGLGSVFGSKNLKAIVLHGSRPVALHDAERFLQVCLSKRQQIHRDPNAIKLREEGSFLLLKQNGRELGYKNYRESGQPNTAHQWRTTYLIKYLYGKEACFSCPIHCGRISEIEGNYFGGVHLETAWSLGHQIGIGDWEKTLWLHRICQLQGLDPVAVGSLLSWIMDCGEKGVLSSEDLGLVPCRWGDEKAASQMIDRIVEGKEAGEVLGRGSLRAAMHLRKGLDEVPHFWGMDLPVRDPRSSREHTLSRALFPMEWDYLQSLADDSPSPKNLRSDQSSDPRIKVLAAQGKRILADLTSLCPLVVARFPLLSVPDIEEMTAAATGGDRDDGTLTAAVTRTMQAERILWRRSGPEVIDVAPFPLRFFRSEEEEKRLENEIADCNALESPFSELDSDLLPRLPAKRGTSRNGSNTVQGEATSSS